MMLNSIVKLFAALAAAALTVSPTRAQNQALRLDGSGDGVVVPSTPALDVQAAYTFEAWVKYEGAAGSLLRKDGWNQLAYVMGAGSAGIGVLHNWWHNYQAGAGCGVAPGSALGSWTHVAATFDGTNSRIYRNGLLTQTCSLPQPWVASTFPLHIGWDNSAYGGPAYFQGSIDEVRIWNVARSASEILQTVNITIDNNVAGNFPGLAACWNFDGNASDSRSMSDGYTLGDATYVSAPDIPVLDCDGNGVVDAVELASGLATDCNSNGVVDTCDIASGLSADSNANGLPDECENLISTYCTAGTSVHGCVASIAGVGTPSTTSASGFNIVVSNVPGQRYGTIFYGFYPANVPWAPNSPSYRCVSFPIQRMGNLPTHGTASQCNGDLTIDFNAWYAANPGTLGAPFVAGQVFYTQGWYRDPAAPMQTNLSNGLRFTLCN